MRLTLLADGTSDRALIPIIEWALWESGVRADVQTTWADFRGLRDKPVTLTQRVAKALELYPCDVLFVHRDSEAETLETRLDEICLSISALPENHIHVPVIPVKMLESWLLLDETAIRFAAGNPNGSVELEMPNPDRVEAISNPKEVIFALLRMASGKSGRRLAALHVESARTFVSQHIGDFSRLRTLASFRHFEKELGEVVEAHHLRTWT